MKMCFPFVNFISSVCLSSTLLANVPVADIKDDSTVINWEITEEETVAIEKKRSYEGQLEEQIRCDFDALTTAPTKKNNAASKEAKSKFTTTLMQASTTLASSSYVNSTHSGVFHQLLSASNGIVGIEDGSYWYVYPGDESLTWNWLTSTTSWNPDYVVVAPDYRLFSYPYRLVNQQTGATVRASLYVKPKPSYLGGNARWIYSLVWLTDIYGNYFVQLCLDDGSVWNMLAIDFPVSNGWKVNDVVIIGANRGDYAGVAPNILINATYNSYAAGACILY